MTNLFDPTQRALVSVTNSAEFQRIAALPRRVLDLSQDTSPYFVKPTSNLKVWPIQSAALIEASRANGLFAPIPVGKGKTFICLALPDVLESKKAVILVKPQLRDQLKEEIDSFYAVNFNLPLDRITIVAYSELSAQSGAFILEEIMPDLIVADEAHCLRHRESARSKRFFRYMREHPGCRFAALSGTMTNRNISDYAHLIELALHKNSPLPRSYHELQDWAGALDVKPERITLPGKLLTFCEGTESVREGFQRRVNETPGVVTDYGEDDVGASLTIQRIMFDVPPEVEEAYEAAQENWEFADEVFTSPLELQRFLCQVSCGFYYRWVWPDGIVDTEWLEARKAWNHEVRQALKRSRAGFDSPGLLLMAAENGTWKSSTWLAWQAVKNRPEPPTVTVWIKQYLHNHVLAWIRSIGEARGIIWYEHDAVGTYLAEVCDLPLYDPSRDPRVATEQVIVASLAAHGDGKNLQHLFSRQLWTSLPPNGTKVEQGIGRCHRPGQLDDTVEVSWFGQTAALGAAFQQVLLDAEYVEQTTGYRQKVLYASRLTTNGKGKRK